MDAFSSNTIQIGLRGNTRVVDLNPDLQQVKSNLEEVEAQLKAELKATSNENSTSTINGSQAASVKEGSKLSSNIVQTAILKILSRCIPSKHTTKLTSMQTPKSPLKESDAAAGKFSVHGKSHSVSLKNPEEGHTGKVADLRKAHLAYLQKRSFKLEKSLHLSPIKIAKDGTLDASQSKFSQLFDHVSLFTRSHSAPLVGNRLHASPEACDAFIAGANEPPLNLLKQHSAIQGHVTFDDTHQMVREAYNKSLKHPLHEAEMRGIAVYSTQDYRICNYYLDRYDGFQGNIDSWKKNATDSDWEPIAKKSPEEQEKFMNEALKATEQVVLMAASGLNKLPNYQGKVFRAAMLPEAELARFTQAHTEGSKKKGAILYENKFLSTTKDKKQTNNFIGAPEVNGPKKYPVRFEIEPPLQGKDIENYSLNPEEKEILFGPGSAFISTGIKTEPALKNDGTPKMDKQGNPYNVTVITLKQIMD